MAARREIAIKDFVASQCNTHDRRSFILAAKERRSEESDDTLTGLAGEGR
jgi:hypothetical protein